MVINRLRNFWNEWDWLFMTALTGVAVMLAGVWIGRSWRSDADYHKGRADALERVRTAPIQIEVKWVAPNGKVFDSGKIPYLPPAEEKK